MAKLSRCCSRFGGGLESEKDLEGGRIAPGTLRKCKYTPGVPGHIKNGCKWLSLRIFCTLEKCYFLQLSSIILDSGKLAQNKPKKSIKFLFCFLKNPNICLCVCVRKMYKKFRKIKNYFVFPFPMLKKI